MKTKSILMSILLAMGFIAAKAATGYPPELALVSQPVMVYNYNSITVYYDVENIGDYTYRGNVYLYLDPDYGYYYANEYIKVRPGNIKRIAIDIPARRIDRGYPFTIMPYYELDDELYSFTTFEYFEPLSFYWEGPRTERWVVISAPPRIHIYTRPGSYRYYYDGFRPPMPPPPGHGHGHGHGHGTPPPMDPKHHTYGYHHNNGGYPATHNVTPPAPHDVTPPTPHNDGSEPAPSATVRPKTEGGSMSSGNNHSNNPPTPAPNGGSSSSVKPNNGNTGSGRTPSGNSGSSGRKPSNNGNVSRPGSNSGTGNSSSSGRTGNTGNSGVSRPSSGSNSNNSGSTRSSSGSVSNGSSSRSSAGTSSSSSTRSSSSSSSSRSSSSSSSSSSSRSGSGAGRR